MRAWEFLAPRAAAFGAGNEASDNGCERGTTLLRTRPLHTNRGSRTQAARKAAVRDESVRDRPRLG
jgi:hypothetical protein